MEHTQYFDVELAQNLVDHIAVELGQNVNITNHKGLIIASFNKNRIGMIHEVAEQKLKAGEYREFAVTEEEARQYRGVRSGVNVPVLYDDICYGFIGVTGDPVIAAPYARLAAKLVKAILCSISHKERLSEAMRDNQRMRALLLNQMIRIQEEERKRISRELHDETSQSLTAVLLGLRALATSLGDETQKKRVLEMRDIVSEALSSVHYMAVRLRPILLDELGIRAAIAKYIETYQKRYNIKVSFISKNIQEGERFFPEIEISVYRIVQEALSNIVKHAEAKEIHVELTCESELLQLVIQDDGKGFDPDILEEYQVANNSLGIAGMQERTELLGGTFEITSAWKEGTRIVVEIPVKTNSRKEGNICGT
ncbi:MAG: ATP-binding protein [Selenomonadales bacterium]|nr:ATP-binding protein [Selenomonadales bacterium]MBR0324810.1 ATP-binding protein [Selenomonadales bacterium]